MNLYIKIRLGGFLVGVKDTFSFLFFFLYGKFKKATKRFIIRLRHKAVYFLKNKIKVVLDNGYCVVPLT